jgi:pimeloyl-ACP methyl ester carboxylesterase
VTKAETTQLQLGGLGLETLDLAPSGADGPVLVLLHDGLGSVAAWRDFPAELNRATGRRTIAFSRFGHGSSAPPPNPRSPGFFHTEALAVLPEVLAQLGVRQPVLIGHSDGASIALIHAAHRPVGGLVLLAPHVFVEEMTLQEIRNTREQYLYGDLRERMARRHDDPDAAFWGWCNVWLDPAFRSWRLDQEVRRLTAPTLLIQGTEDPYGSLDQLDRIQRGAPGPVRRLLISGGHRLHREHPEDLIQAISAFLAGLPVASS